MISGRFSYPPPLESFGDVAQPPPSQASVMTAEFLLQPPRHDERLLQQREQHDRIRRGTLIELSQRLLHQIVNPVQALRYCHYETLPCGWN